MATKDKLINLEDLKVLSDHVEGEVTDLKSDFNRYLEPTKNLFDLYGVTFTDNEPYAKHSLEENTLKVEAVAANANAFAIFYIDVRNYDTLYLNVSSYYGSTGRALVRLASADDMNGTNRTFLGSASETNIANKKIDVSAINYLGVAFYAGGSATVIGSYSTFTDIYLSETPFSTYTLAKTPKDVIARERLSVLSNKVNMITEQTPNILDIYSADFVVNKCSVSFNQKDITITNDNGDGYSWARFDFDVTDIDRVYFQATSATGTGDSRIRIYNADTNSWISWVSGISGSVDTSDISTLGIALYVETSSTGTVGEYTTYSEITVSSVPISESFISGTTAIDYVARWGSNSANVPDYYDSYLSNKIARINELINATAAHGDAFVFITDAHWMYNAKQSPKLLKYIYQKTHIYKLFCGGDMSNSKTNDDTYFEVGSTLRDAWSGEAHYTMGNHEYLGATNGEVTTEDNLYYYYRMYAENENGSADRHYYYFDNDRQKIRYVFLNKYAESTNDGASAGLGYEQEQINWFTNTALAVETGWTIVIVTHNIFNIVPDASYNITESIPSNSQPIYDAIANYSGNGTIAAVVCGHAHLDYVTSIGNVPCIITTCDKNKSGGEAVPDAATWAAIWSARKSGAIYEQAFDVMILDKENRKITAVRIGYPSTVENGGTAVEEREITY